MASSVPAETIICKNLPGDTEGDRQIRVALLRVHHVCENLDSRVEAIGYRLADFLQDPEPLYTARLLEGAIIGLLQAMEAAQFELRKSAKTFLPLAQERYARTTALLAAETIEERQAIQAE